MMNEKREVSILKHASNFQLTFFSTYAFYYLLYTYFLNKQPIMKDNV